MDLEVIGRRSSILILTGLLLALVAIRGSDGDRDPVFRKCVYEALESNGCVDKAREEEHELRSYLAGWAKYGAQGRGAVQRMFTGWYQYSHMSCTEHCVRMCSDGTNRRRLARGLNAHKYFGHWSFYHYFGLEEPASSLFSLGNAVPHMLEILRQIRSPLSSNFRCRVASYKQSISGASSAELCRAPTCSDDNTYFLQPWADLYPYVALLAWVSSAVYHSKRTEETELLDLSTALLLLAYGLAITARRLAGPHAKWSHVTVATGCGIGLVTWRVHAMTTPGRVPFQRHMTTAISLVVASVSLWVLWLFTSRDQHSSLGPGGANRYLVWPLFNHGGSLANKLRMLAFQLSFVAAGMLELFDFPPLLGTFDAHALWHACTIPLGFIWYDFIREDKKYILSNRKKTDKKYL